MSEPPKADHDRVIVVGAGGAGLMAAIAAAHAGARVLVLEKTRRIGYKILISGKGRCNITNAQTELKELLPCYPGGGKFLRTALSQFGTQDAVRFFEELGVPTRRDRGGRIFPASDQSRDVVDALVAELSRLGGELELEAPVAHVRTEQGAVVGVELTDDRCLGAGAVVVTVGGQSFPGTGSTGDGYRMARELGHRVVEPFPALVPLKVAGYQDLDGLELRNVKATVVADGKPLIDRLGEMRFAHFGITGAIVLYLSRHAVAAQRQGQVVEIHLNLKPALTREQLDAGLRRDWEAAPRVTIAMALRERLPERLIGAFLRAAEVPAERRVSELPRAERQRLIETMTRWRLPVVCPLSREVAEVTAGGVDLAEIDPRTMASRKVAGLYWAGEVIDVDGVIGGYNLQAAWSTGWLAGRAAAERVRAASP